MIYPEISHQTLNITPLLRSKYALHGIYVIKCCPIDNDGVISLVCQMQAEISRVIISMKRI